MYRWIFVHKSGLALVKGCRSFLKREYIDRSKLCFDGFNNKDS